MSQEADSIIMVFSIERRLGDYYLNPKASAVQVHVVVYPTDVKCIRTAWFIIVVLFYECYIPAVQIQSQ